MVSPEEERACKLIETYFANIIPDPVGGLPELKRHIINEIRLAKAQAFLEAVEIASDNGPNCCDCAKNIRAKADEFLA